MVDTKAPGDAAAFKGWLRQISQHVAEAATEDGFLGFGRVPVSEGEKATLTEISHALRLAASPRALKSQKESVAPRGAARWLVAHKIADDEIRCVPTKNPTPI